VRRSNMGSKAPRQKVISSPLRPKPLGVPVTSLRGKRRSLQPQIGVRTPRAKGATASHVKVAVRVRPRNEREQGVERFVKQSCLPTVPFFVNKVQFLYETLFLGSL
jgi:hypothetical protein